MLMRFGGSNLPPGLTWAELLALPASVPLEVGNRAFDIGRTSGYALRKQNASPCRVVRVGDAAYRVISLFDVLSVHPDDVPQPA